MAHNFTITLHGLLLLPESVGYRRAFVTAQGFHGALEPALIAKPKKWLAEQVEKLGQAFTGVVIGFEWQADVLRFAHYCVDSAGLTYGPDFHFFYYHLAGGQLPWLARYGIPEGQEGSVAPVRGRTVEIDSGSNKLDIFEDTTGERICSLQFNSLTELKESEEFKLTL